MAEHRLPKAYDYHKMPAPFIQVRLLKLLAVLGAGDAGASADMYAVVGDALRRAAACGHTVGHAVAAECVRTATEIHPSPALLDAAAGVVSGFLRSPSRNLRYAGVACLEALVRVAPALAADHQLAVIDCLEDCDESLRSATLGLLCKMARPANVEARKKKKTGGRVRAGHVRLPRPATLLRAR